MHHAAMFRRKSNGSCALGTTCCDTGLSDSQGCDVGECFVPNCSEEFPGGACPTGLVCAGGACSNPPCSSAYPQGSCGPNLTCDGGVCVFKHLAVMRPRRDFAGMDCVALREVVRIMFAVMPSPTRHVPLEPLSGWRMHNASLQSRLSGGACGAGEVCVGGVCIDQPCSTAYPSGVCAAGYTRVAGACVPGACSAEAPTGSCSGSDAGRICVEGVCRDYVCSEFFPTGPCDGGEICDASSGTPACIVPACSPEYIGGACAGENEICIGGVCTLPPCSENVLNGQCPPSQICCDEALVAGIGCGLGTCTLADCSAENPDGRCGAGEICCNEDYLAQGLCSNLGTCLGTPCSDAFPYGTVRVPVKGRSWSRAHVLNPVLIRHAMDGVQAVLIASTAVARLRALETPIAMESVMPMSLRPTQSIVMATVLPITSTAIRTTMVFPIPPRPVISI